jgi:hypothetical protein
MRPWVQSLTLGKEKNQADNPNLEQDVGVPGQFLDPNHDAPQLLAEDL